tara:strand:- start:812 stop:1717 length:906 start_codon:yes stop_codon:yes gene_type:complete
MAKDNTDNLSKDEALQEASDNVFDESPSAFAPAGTEDSFFEELDNSVNAAQMETPLSEDAIPQPNQTTPVAEKAVDSGEEKHNYEKRYTDSSKEARRLNSRLGELEPYLPLLDAMRDDPNLITHVKNYFEGGGQAPESMTEELGLDEDFIFDGDEAIKDPKSSSAKVLNRTVDGMIQKRLGQFQGQQVEENRKLKEASAFRQKHNLDDNDYQEFMNYAKEHKLSLDDILYLKTRKNVNEKVATATKEELLSQMKNVRQRPKSLGSTGDMSASGTQSKEDAVFDKLMNVDVNTEEVDLFSSS